MHTSLSPSQTLEEITYTYLWLPSWNTALPNHQGALKSGTGMLSKALCSFSQYTFVTAWMGEAVPLTSVHLSL